MVLCKDNNYTQLHVTFSIVILLFLVFTTALQGQTSISSTNPIAETILTGNYNPVTYLASTILNRPDTLSAGINAAVNADSLKTSILRLSAFYNRNTGSDTLSAINGMGAARRWVYSTLQRYSASSQNRLMPSYLQFTQSICSVNQHRDVFAVLPGMDTTDKSIIIIEGHLDSRCEGLCDTLCKAEGVEDNASGTALVLELARVMSRYSYNHTLVFLITTGEEQGLYGAMAFATYAQQKGIKIKAVLNNDVIGGIICGNTSSAPSCPGPGNLDSTQVRLFSQGAFNSPHKGLARFVKLEYNEQLKGVSTVPMTISIMSPEDRTGRGGDHIPFRQLGFTAIRFTSANEDGNANVTSPTYTDRQHSTRDTLGASKTHNGVIDSFFVNFPYLGRNAIINGNAAAMLGIGPKQPDLILTAPSAYTLRIQIIKQTQYHQYRIGLRTLTNDWDSLYTLTGKLIDTLRNLNPATYFVSVMSVDSNGIESLPSTEYTASTTSINELKEHTGIHLLGNRPNPFDEATYIDVLVDEYTAYKQASIEVKDIGGKLVKTLPLRLDKGINEVLFEHEYQRSGIYYYTLVIDGKRIQTKEMIFAD